MIAGEEVGVFTEGLALSGSVAVRDSAEMNVGVCVGSHQLEDEVETTAAFLPAFRGSSTLSLWVALNKTGNYSE